MLPEKTGSTGRFQSKQELILSSAARIFNKHGVRGGTLSEIAGGVGLATNSITYYYRKREDLAAACLFRSIKAFKEIMLRIAEIPDMEQRVRALFDHEFELLARIARGEHPPLIHWAHIRGLEPPEAESVFAAYIDMAKTARRLLIGPQTAGLTRADVTARGYLLLSHVAWLRAHAESIDVEEFPVLARRISDRLLRGMAKPHARWPVCENQEAFWERFKDHPMISDQFLCAGSALVNEYGYRGASIDQIAARLNLTKGAFYGRRANKDELIEACFERRFAVARLAWDAPANEAGSATVWERVCAAVQRLAWFQMSPLGPLLRGQALAEIPLQERRDAIRRAIRLERRYIANLILDGMEDGSVLPGDPEVAASSLRCVLDTAAGLARWEPSTCMDNIASLYLRPALFGLLVK